MYIRVCIYMCVYICIYIYIYIYNTQYDRGLAGPPGPPLPAREGGQLLAAVNAAADLSYIGQNPFGTVGGGVPVPSASAMILDLYLSPSLSPHLSALPSFATPPLAHRRAPYH